MTSDKQLMQMALDDLSWAYIHLRADKGLGKTVEALRARLAQPEPEPVAWKDAPSKIYLQVCDESDCDQPFDSHIEVSWCHDKINDSDIAYIRADTAPPQREWQGLTDEERAQIWDGIIKYIAGEIRINDFAKAIEAKLKEKNG